MRSIIEDLLLPAFAAIPMLLWALMGYFQMRATERFLVGLLLVGLPCLMNAPLFGMALSVVVMHAVALAYLLVQFGSARTAPGDGAKIVEALCLILGLVEMALIVRDEKSLPMICRASQFLACLVAERSLHPRFWEPARQTRYAVLYAAFVCVVCWNMLSFYHWYETGMRLERSWLGSRYRDWFTPNLIAILLTGIGLPSRRLIPMACLVFSLLLVMIFTGWNFGGGVSSIINYLGLTLAILGVLLPTDAFCQFLDRRAIAVGSSPHSQ